MPNTNAKFKDLSTDELRKECVVLLNKLANWDAEKKEKDKLLIRNLAETLGLSVSFLEDKA